MRLSDCNTSTLNVRTHTKVTAINNHYLLHGSFLLIRWMGIMPIQWDCRLYGHTILLPRPPANPWAIAIISFVAFSWRSKEPGAFSRHYKLQATQCSGE